MSKTRTLILNLDGTLIDSAEDLRAALNRLMVARRAAPFSRTDVIGMIGDGIDALVARALISRDMPFNPAAVDAVRADYGARCTEETRPYPGVELTLRTLAAEGWRLGVCTNKPEAPARAILAALGLDVLVHSVTGGDGPRKPNPAHMRAAVEAAGGSPHFAIAVGDHANDIKAATGAGMRAIFARWGYGAPGMDAGATATANSIAEIPAIAARLLDPATVSA